MLLKKIPKRSILFCPGELKDILELVFTRSINEGKFVKEFEDRFKRFIGVKHAVAVSSGRFALYLILKSLGLKAGDGVLLSAYNFKGVPKALLQDGFTPVFVDADESSYQINVSEIEKQINPKVKAIILTHLFGQPCQLDKIMDIARKYNLFVIEDAAHSLGSYYQGKHTGTLGDAGFFSFSGSKMLNTSFGGIIVTNNDSLAVETREELSRYNFPSARQLLRERITTYIYALLTQRIFYSLTEYPLTLLMSMFGLDPLEIYKSFKHTEITEKKMKFTNLQALLGLRQIDCLNSLISKRKNIAEKLFKALDPLISLQANPKGCNSNYFMVPIKAKDKFRVFRRLLLKGVDSNLNYASDCSDMVKGTSIAISQALSKSVLTINLPFDLTDKEIGFLAQSLNEIKELLH